MAQLTELQCTLVKIVFSQLIGNEALFHKSVDEFHRQEGYVMDDEVTEALLHTALKIDNIPAAALLDAISTISQVIAKNKKFSSISTLLLRDTDVLMLINNKKAELTFFIPAEIAFVNYFSFPVSKEAGRKQESFANFVRNEDPRESIALIRRHIATGRVPSLKGMKVGSSFTVRMASADIFIVECVSKKKWTVSNGNGAKAAVLEIINASNGKIIVIGSVFESGDSKKERIVYDKLPPRPDIVYAKLEPESPYGQIPTVYGTMPEKPELVYVDLRPEVV